MRLGHFVVQTDSLIKTVIDAINITQPIKVTLSSCYGGAALSQLKSILPDKSSLYSLASYDETGVYYALDSNIKVDHDFEIEDHMMLSYCFSRTISSSPIYFLEGEDMGNLIGIAKVIASQITFSTKIKDTMLADLSHLLPKPYLEYVWEMLSNDKSFFENHHYDSRDSVEGIQINSFFIALGIMYYLHKMHFPGLSIEAVEYSTPIHTQSIFMFVENGDIEGAELLINAGRDVNIINGFGVSALHVAADEGSAEVAQRLIDAGAKLNIIGLKG